MWKWLDKKAGETVGQGDHYVQPIVAAALFGLAAVLKDTHGITMDFGDMSADNGTDPWEKGSEDHKGHGHGDRSGLDIDFRYINYKGVSFRGLMTDKQFSVAKNQLVFDTAAKFGFTENYQGNSAKLKGIKTAGGHNNHGHLGYGR